MARQVVYVYELGESCGALLIVITLWVNAERYHAVAANFE